MRGKRLRVAPAKMGRQLYQSTSTLRKGQVWKDAIQSPSTRKDAQLSWEESGQTENVALGTDR